MKFRELCVLLPCHSLEDFPLHHQGKDADSLLACWTALWHPALLAAANTAPQWHRADVPPEDFQDRLILVPTVGVSHLPENYVERAKAGGALILCGERDRRTLLDAVIGQLEGGDGGAESELVKDFLALGYAYLQIQVLTRQMRYSSHLDEAHFFNQVLAGAQASLNGQREEAQGKVTACFDLLGQERDHYYSVDAYLIDLTLVAESTMGSALRTELAGPTPINLLIPGVVAAAIAEREPETLQAIVAAIQAERVSVVSGELEEQRLPLLACEDILAELKRGQPIFERIFGRRLDIYARRSFGLTPFLPSVLEKLRFRGAFHASLDDGHFPSASQTKTRWQGVDASVVDAIAKPPLDASKPDIFLSLAQRLGESMDTDHVATICLAHWPGMASPWYDDLRRAARFTSALGKFIVVERYFADTYLPSHLDRFDIDQYISPYLRQDVDNQRPDPISSTMRYWHQRIMADSAESIAVLAAVIGGVPAGEPESAGFSQGRLGGQFVELPQPRADTTRNVERLAAEVDQQTSRLAAVLPRQATSPQPGLLVVNPWSFVRRMCVDVSELSSLPVIEKPVYAADEANGKKYAVVDVPPMGFAWLQAGDSASAGKKKEPRLAEDSRSREGVLSLRNEFIEASIHPTTGALQGLKDYDSRGNRISQQLAYRLGGEPRGRSVPGREPGDPANYSVMAADEVSIVHSSAAYGEIRARGRLLRHDGQPVARFVQVWRLCRGSRVLQLDVELEPLMEPGADPWNSYCSCRFAWSDEMAELYQSVNQTRQRVSKQRIESPLYVEIDTGARRTTILTGGLPYHRRFGERMLDSLLAVRGESARSFRCGIGLDLTHPLPEALAILGPQPAIFQNASPPVPSNCWLFHLDARSVVATHWSSIHEQGQIVGVRLRLLESAGRNVRTRLSGFRPFTSARQLNFLGETLSEVPLDQGKLVLHMTAHEWIEVEARWSKPG